MRLCVPAIVVLAACGGGSAADRAVGVYQVVLHTANDTGCTEGPAVDSFTYFKFDYFGPVDGQRTYSVGACTGADDTTCDDILAFVSDTPTGLFSSFQLAVPAGTDCTLDYVAYDGLLLNDTFELRTTSYEEVETSPPSCTEDDALARGESMPCIGLEHLVGTRL